MLKINRKLFLLTFLSVLFATNVSTQDWASLERFKKENASLILSPDQSDRVVFMGNSITEGWLQDSTSMFHQYGFINRGISGQTTPQMLLRFRQDVVDLNPKVVVILAGINDIAGNTGPSTLDMIFDNIQSMVEIALANNIKVVLSSVLPAKDFPWRPGLEPAEKVVRLNEMMEDHAKKKDLIYLDYFSRMVNGNLGLKEELTYDQVHPTLVGYKVMEPLALEAVHKALQRN
ncbi:MAG: acylhydrolase [Saprospiraceae bacterium]|nr:acylhydrolase [Saprospiraceae bacterium]